MTMVMQRLRRPFAGKAPHLMGAGRNSALQNGLLRGRACFALILMSLLWFMMAPTTISQAQPYKFMDSDSVDTVKKPLTDGTATLRDNTRNVVMGFGAISLIALAALAMFGTIRWVWFFSLLGGMTMLVMIDNVQLFLGYKASDGTVVASSALYGSDAAGKVFGNTEGVCKGVKVSYDNIRTIAYAIGGVALVGMAIVCMFGNMRWVWFFSALGGLTMIAVIDQVLAFFNYSSTSCTVTTGALFSDTTVFSTVGDAGTRSYQNVRTMSYAVGGIAMVALGVMSMFGKLRFSVLFMAIAGLAMIALIDQAFLYFGGSEIADLYSTP
jgi:uncharacterized membrane protein